MELEGSESGVEQVQRWVTTRCASPVQLAPSHKQEDVGSRRLSYSILDERNNRNSLIRTLLEYFILHGYPIPYELQCCCRILSRI